MKTRVSLKIIHINILTERAFDKIQYPFSKKPSAMAKYLKLTWYGKNYHCFFQFY